MNRCNELGLIERCTKIPCRLATNDELLMKHTQEIIDMLKSTEDLKDFELLEALSSKFDAIYFHPVSKV
jgi:histone deacetylase 6